jgi:lactoylglutathione lyase
MTGLIMKLYITIFVAIYFISSGCAPSPNNTNYLKSGPEYQIGVCGLLVKDIDKTVEFYKRVFGFRVIQSKSTNRKGDSRAFIKSGKSIIEIIELKDKAPGYHTGVIDHITFVVDNLEYEVERLKELGVQLESKLPSHITTSKIKRVRNGRIFYFRGINGELIGLVELNKNNNFKK